MISKILSIIGIITMLTVHRASAQAPGFVGMAPKLLSEKTYSLSDRYSNSYVNNVFSDNILLTLAYMSGQVKQGQAVNWNKVKGNFKYSFTLKPGTSFAFHDDILPQYKNQLVGTTNAHFNSDEGFESDGWLVGDGVCHLASFMNVVARQANLLVLSPTAHDFANIPDVPRKYGVAIFATSSLQNLYVTNTYSKPISFIFTHTGKDLDIKVEQI